MSYYINIYFMSLGSRLKEFIENNFTNGLISRIIRENGNMNSKHLQVIGENYPELNMNWLLNGEGEMLKDNDNDLDQETNEKLLQDIKFYKETIKALTKAVEQKQCTTISSK